MTHKHEHQWQIHNEPVSRIPKSWPDLSVSELVWAMIVLSASAFMFALAVVAYFSL